ncbi:MAG: hypothetical protein AAF560_14575 [Acidobacteriota bacterium]
MTINNRRRQLAHGTAQIHWQQQDSGRLKNTFLLTYLTILLAHQKLTGIQELNGLPLVQADVSAHKENAFNVK